MIPPLRSERATQNRVIQLFKSMGYTYLGNWEARPNNSPVEYELLESFLISRGVSKQHRDAVRLKLSQAASVLGHTLYEANRKIYTLLRYGVQVAALGKPTETVHLIDWQNPQNNRFAIAEEVTLSQGSSERRPDLVLYINGFAIAVIELKRSSVNAGDGIRQLVTNQQSNPYFFVAAQLLFAGSDAEGLYYGTCLTKEQFYVKWKAEQTPAHAEPGCYLDIPLSQMCEKSQLLDWLHDCVIFDAGIKKVPRQHQYLGLKAAQQRINRQEGGVIWHTQGSGKTILMVMLTKWILEHKPLARVLIMTDRTELDQQIQGVMQATGVIGESSPSSGVTSRQDLKNKLQSPSPRLLCALMHKIDIGQDTPPNVHGEFFVLVDECHRTQGGKLHTKMKEWLPHAIFIGFTGTPLMKADAKATRYVFGSYIHTYKFPQAVADGVVLDLVYEARTIPQKLTSPKDVDNWFNSKTAGLSAYQKALLRQHWGTMERLLSSKSRISRIVGDICADFGEKPRLSIDRGTAMLVAASIYDACRYFRQFQDATILSGKCGIITSYEPSAVDISREPVQGKEHYKYETYKKYVLSPDLPTTQMYEARMKRLFQEEPANCKLLIVVSKLLVGFDAPTCSYIYLDKKLQDHGLFQAITRTNRLDGPSKICGHVVDYKEQFHSVKDSIAVYSADDLESSSSNPNIDNITLKDLLKEGRKRLEEAREAIKQLCDPVPPPKELENFCAFFCGNASNPADLEEKSRLRDELYKQTARLIRAYAELARQIIQAGYSQEEAQKIEQEVHYFTELRDAIKKHAAEDLDVKSYESDMRHLIDTYISAEDPHKQGTMENFTLIELIVKTGIHNAVAAKWNKKISKISVAEGIINNIRKAVNDKKQTDPKYYEDMSKLLTDLLEELKKGALAYEDFLKQIEEQAKKLSLGNTAEGDIPSALTQSPFAVAMFNNLSSLPKGTFTCPQSKEERANLALSIKDAMDKKAPANWRGVASRESAVQQLLYTLLNSDENATRALFSIIKASPYYE